MNRDQYVQVAESTSESNTPSNLFPTAWCKFRSRLTKQQLRSCIEMARRTFCLKQIALLPRFYLLPVDVPLWLLVIRDNCQEAFLCLLHRLTKGGRMN